jgi:hypothetical protein
MTPTPHDPYDSVLIREGDRTHGADEGRILLLVLLGYFLHEKILCDFLVFRESFLLAWHDEEMGVQAG